MKQSIKAGTEVDKTNLKKNLTEPEKEHWMSYWLNKTFPDCNFRIWSSLLKQVQKLIKLPETQINACNIVFKVLRIVQNID